MSDDHLTTFERWHIQELLVEGGARIAPSQKDLSGTTYVLREPGF